VLATEERVEGVGLKSSPAILLLLWSWQDGLVLVLASFSPRILTGDPCDSAQIATFSTDSSVWKQPMPRFTSFMLSTFVKDFFAIRTLSSPVIEVIEPQLSSGCVVTIFRLSRRVSDGLVWDLIGTTDTVASLARE